MSSRSVADLRGLREVPAPWGSKFFQRHAFLAKSYVGAPGGFGAPTIGGNPGSTTEDDHPMSPIFSLTDNKCTRILLSQVLVHSS